MQRHYEIYGGGNDERMAIPVGFSLAAMTSWVWAYALRLWVEATGILVVNVVFAVILYANHTQLWTYAAGQVALGLIVASNARRLREMAAERSGYFYICTIPGRGRADALAKLSAVGGQPLPEWRARMLSGIPDFAPKSLRGLLAIAFMTVKSAFRSRLVVAILFLLLLVVLVLPGVIKHDGSARGFTQILITYTLGTITILMGFTTLWLGCSAIARDIEEMQLFLVAAKPIPRWQIWLGKWLGIMAINAGMLAIAGAIVYGLVLARTGELSVRERARLKAEVLVARALATESTPDNSEDVERIVNEKMREEGAAKRGREFVRKQVEEQMKAMQQVVRPSYLRRWVIELGPSAPARLAGKPLFIRTKFFSAQGSAEGKSFMGRWEIGPPDGRRYQVENSLGAESFVEFQIPSETIAPDGKLTIDFQNWNEVPLLFTLDEGMAVLYPEGSFFLNYVRGLCIILAWLGLLASIGLAGSSVFSFPVAAFCALGALILGLSGNTLKSVVEQGGIMGVNHETGTIDKPDALNQVAVMVYGGVKKLLDEITGYSPVGYLSTGLSITWLELAKAITFINIILGGIVSLAGITALSRRELAAPTKF
ncbi:MAG TPA: hypothetical protein VMF06_02215 [Candidatus Limnocylindria bacterium]|nr:hypothetical protein [Candidatus Limnocylindria bacterium]